MISINVSKPSFGFASFCATLGRIKQLGTKERNYYRRGGPRKVSRCIEARPHHFLHEIERILRRMFRAMLWHSCGAVVILWQCERGGGGLEEEGFHAMPF